MQVCQEEPRRRVLPDGGVKLSSQRWRTLVRTTGESTFAGSDIVDPGGQAARVLEFHHPGITPEVGRMIYAFTDRPTTYGHAGIRFLTKLNVLVNDPEKSGVLVERYKALREILVKELGSERPAYDNLAAIALGEYLMLMWVYGESKEQAWASALRDCIDIGANYLRSKDDSDPLWQRVADFMIEHRHTMPQCYADLNTVDGQSKIRDRGSNTSTPLVGCFNGGRDGKEIWYFPETMSRILKSQFNLAPTRLWEELAERGFLERGKDRLQLHREKGGAWSGRVMVVKADRLFSVPGKGPILIDVSKLAAIAPKEEVIDDGSESAMHEEGETEND
jgi:hypothetical protein